ncbi:hypothetical protein [Streptomyces sp. NPDC002187]|uniref:hypothetical protein n=1 Tax=Streptomyces sp. NPDC002187 TaxID=3364637 RepID=UPI0036B58BD0
MNHLRLAPAVVAALLTACLTACGSDGGGSGASPTATVSPTPRDTSTETPRSQREFEESVSAEAARVRASASAELAQVEGRGNAIADVSQTGVPTARSDGSRAALVRVTNRTSEPAFYSVQVDFVGADGSVVDSVVLGFDDIPAGERAQQYAISKKAGEQQTTPRIAKAQRS